MKLKNARVENFKCIRDSDEFAIDPLVTCLVGKNESGKTALLQALNKLNPVVEAHKRFEDTDFPRTLWSEYQETKSDKPANVLTTTWTLSPDDKTALAAVLGPTANSIDEVVISKGYANESLYRVKVDEAAVVGHVIERHDLNEQEAASLNQVNTIKAMKERVAAIQPQSPQVQAVGAFLQQHFARGTATLAAIDILSKRLPKIVYFTEYMRLSGQMALEDFKANRQNPAHPKANEYRMFEALLSLVNKTAEDIEKIDRFEALQAELEAVSARLSKTIFKYWSQNKHLLVRFRFDAARAADPAPFNTGWIMRTRIENTRHASTTSFDDRSTGFVWFFSFLVWFSQMKKNYGNNLVILLDEPGNSLHAKAQADLLRYIEEQLAPVYQVVYTTHSPFMIDPAHLLRARTVEDVVFKDAQGEEELLGTKVGDDVLSTDKDTVFPLQAALGFEITQTLFVGKHTLLVEGPSDLLYIKWFQQELDRLNRSSLDRRWTISPCGGIDKIASFMSLLRGNSLHCAVLTDYKHGDKKKVRSLIESKLLADGHVLTADSYAGKPEADIEDLLGPDFYSALVNETYALTAESGIVLGTSGDAGSSNRLVPQVEEVFRHLPAHIAEFDHFAPAERLMSRGERREWPGLSTALDSFERLFVDLNGLLPHGQSASGNSPEVVVRVGRNTASR